MLESEPMCILLLIPCYNEEGNINSIITHLHKVRLNVSQRDDCQLDILIINDGSTDATREILDTCCTDDPYKIIHFAKNRGYGAVLKRGFSYAKDNNYEWVISFDMDGQHEPRCLYKFLDEIHGEPEVEIISGSRYLDPKLFLQNPWKDRFLVNTIITGVLNMLGFSLTDSFCGMKAHDVNKINQLDLSLNGYDMPIEMLMKAKKNNFNIKELAVPVIYKSRDKVVNESAEENFLFQKGEERIARYLEIIRNIHDGSLGFSSHELERLFKKYYETTTEITKDNFFKIQQAILSEINDKAN